MSPLDARSGVTLGVFAIANALVIRPLRIPLPSALRRVAARIARILGRSDTPTHATLGLASAPVVAVLLLLASTCIPPSVVRAGFVGRDGVRPWDVMVLFTSFAYISLSLDHTGLLRYLALHVASRATSPAKLYASLYLLFLALALGVGNDPVVLSGTPFVAYFAASTGLPPHAFAFAQFQAANLACALLVSSNPTNLVLTASFHLSFLQFSAWTALPTVAAGLALLPVLMGTAGRSLPKRIDKVDVQPRAALVDPVGAAFGASVFVVTIVLLVALSAVGILEHGAAGVWCVTAPAALLVLARDVAYDLGWGRPGAAAASGESGEKERASGALGSSDSSEKDSTAPAVVSGRLDAEARDKLDGEADAAVGTTDTPTPASPTPPPTPPHPLRAIRAALPTTSTTLAALPLPLLPFAFSMFILVEALDHTGWVGVWSGWWGAWARASGAAGCIFLMGVVSVIGCNLFGTNIGATVLLSRILTRWIAAAHPSPRARYGSVLALAVGSNFGAYSFVFPASLAGLLWRHILAEKQLHVLPLEFARRNALPLGVTLAVGCLVVAAEVCVMFK
ncbi:Arsenical pump membrane protein [Vanrija pseudolonga]|uniref:Arsenical pump membrane protein n=1 Tax=Vanrija pseudolonga TaxID=143232 RepID=A0AAF0Y1U5_9TREE|nr:Arsenical pump membrane protein [Vanrija pseudolonga]